MKLLVRLNMDHVLLEQFLQKVYMRDKFLVSITKKTLKEGSLGGKDTTRDYE
jgi:hypothetical protein